MNFGGAETRLVDLARFADKSKFYFDFCVFQSESESGDYDSWIRELGYGIVKCKLTKNIFSFSQQFRKLLIQGQYDVIHCHIYQFSGLPLRIAAKAGVRKRIMHLRTTMGFYRKSLYRFCYNKLMSMWIKQYATNIVAVSEAAMTAYMGSQWQADPRTQVIYNGVNVGPFLAGHDRLETLSEFGIPRSAQVVIHVGNFRPAKDHETLVRSAAELVNRKENVHFLLVGSGNLMPKIRAMVVDRGLESHVHFAGSRSDVARLLMASDCFVFPSRWEGLPGVVLEALAAGLPVIASDIGPVREIASQSDNVHLIPTGDVAGFARRTEEILSDLERYRKAPGNIPKRFRFEDYAQKILSLYE